MTTGLRVGTAKRDITPAILRAVNPMGGDFTAVHDRLGLRALVVDDGDRQVSIVSLDLIEVGESDRIRSRIASELDIPADHIMLTPTHTHNAPRMGKVPPGGLGRAATKESHDYTDWVEEQIFDAVTEAQGALQPAQVGYGSGHADVNVNRDQLIAGRWVLGRDDHAPSDKAVRVVAFQTPSGTPLAVLLNYSVHSVATIGTAEISGDLAGAASRIIEEQLDSDAVALWSLGSVADQAPRVSMESSFTARDDRAFAWAYRAAEAQGMIVAAEALRVLGGISDWRASVSVRAEERTLGFPLKHGIDVPPDMIQEEVESVRLRLSLVAIGDVAFAGVSGEVGSLTHRRLLEASPLSATILVSMANERIGYLAADEAYTRMTFAARGTPIQAGHAEDGIVEGLTAMIGRR